MKPSKYFGTSEGVVELRPFKTDDGLTMYRPVTYPCPDGLERYQSFVLQAGKFQTVVSLGIGADAEMIAHAPSDLAALVAEVEQLRAERDGDGDVESGTLWHAQRDVSRLRNELHQIEALRRKAEIRCESLEAQIDAVRELHRRMPVYDTLTDDCEEHDPDAHGIELDGDIYCDQHISYHSCAGCVENMKWEYDDWPECPCETIKALGGEQG